MFGFLLAIHVIVTVLLIFIILIQKSEGGSSLFASGSSNSMFTARGTSNVLTKATWGLATIFLLNCILMAHISANKVKASSTIITGTPHVSKPLSNKAINDLNRGKDDNNKTDLNTDNKQTKDSKNKAEVKNNEGNKTDSKIESGLKNNKEEKLSNNTKAENNNVENKNNNKLDNAVKSENSNVNNNKTQVDTIDNTNTENNTKQDINKDKKD
ncbi:MAG: preprotein translocase subunit SecG [Alphaproteobacteria bacterium]|nr:preprotein translocase subunit SecG [Alphaproteobacteria bacterium]